MLKYQRSGNLIKKKKLQYRADNHYPFLHERGIKMQYILVRERISTDGKYYYEPIILGYDKDNIPTFQIAKMRRFSILSAKGTLIEFKKYLKGLMSINSYLYITAIEDSVYTQIMFDFRNRVRDSGKIRKLDGIVICEDLDKETIRDLYMECCSVVDMLNADMTICKEHIEFKPVPYQLRMVTMRKQ